MRQRTALLLSLLILATGHGLSAAPPTSAHLLDGKTFYGREKVKGGKERNQTYIFKDGTFEAHWWAAAGLQPGPYTATAHGNVVLFTAQTPSKNPEAGLVRWQGKVVGNHIEVTGTLATPNQPPIELSGKADLGEHVRNLMMLKQTLEQMQIPQPGTPEYEQAQQVYYQKITMSQIRNLGTALFAWLTDQVSQPALTGWDPGQTVQLQPYQLVNTEQIRQRLVPKYLEKLDATDGWGRPIEMRLNLRALRGKHMMCLRSAGRDGKLSGNAYKVGSFPPNDLDQDIVWCDGWFVRWPETAQKSFGTASPR